MLRRDKKMTFLASMKRFAYSKHFPKQRATSEFEFQLSFSVTGLFSLFPELVSVLKSWQKHQFQFSSEQCITKLKTIGAHTESRCDFTIKTLKTNIHLVTQSL
jgi:hypothetical protein